MHLNSPYHSKYSVKILKNIFTFQHYPSQITRKQNMKYIYNNVSLVRGYYTLDYISFKPKLIWQYPKKVMKSYQNSLKNTATPNQIEKSELVTFQTFHSIFFLSYVSYEFQEAAKNFSLLHSKCIHVHMCGCMNYNGWECVWMYRSANGKSVLIINMVAFWFRKWNMSSVMIIFWNIIPYNKKSQLIDDLIIYIASSTNCPTTQEQLVI